MSPQVIGESRPVARKEHQCSLCGRVIRRGETYDRARLVWDDAPYVWKQCAHCNVLVRVFEDDAGFYGWYDDDQGYATDTVCEYAPNTIRVLRLKAMFLRHWTRRDGELYPVPGRASS